MFETLHMLFYLILKNTFVVMLLLVFMGKAPILLMRNVGSESLKYFPNIIQLYK